LNIGVLDLSFSPPLTASPDIPSATVLQLFTATDKMAAIAAVLKRLEALEAEVKTLREENENLKMAMPLEAFSNGLRLASDEELQEWYDLCQEKAEELGLETSSTPARAGGGKKEGKTKRKTTNAEGPREWNIFIQATWESMLTAKGVRVPSDPAGFKKAAKEAGVSYHAAMTEAGIRKRAAEKNITRDEAAAELSAGRDARAEKREEKKDGKKPAKKSAPAPAPAKKPAKKAAAPEPEAEDDAELAAAFKEAGFVEIEIQGVLWYMDQDSLDVFKRAEKYVVGDRVGTYDGTTETIEYDEEDE
jgi:hypothetical protein